MPDGERSPHDATPGTSRLRVGAVLSRSLAFYGRHLPVLALVGAVAFLPSLLFELHLARRLRSDIPLEAIAVSAFVVLGLYFLLPLFVQAATTLGVFQHLRGDRVGHLASFRRGLSSLLPVLLMALLLAFLLIAALAAAAIPSALLRRTVEDDSARRMLGGLLALLALTWVYAIHFVAVQALVVERLLPWTALRRSAGLTRGSRWRVFVLLVVVVVARWLAGLAIQRVLLDDAGSWEAVRAAIYVRTGITALFAAFVAVCAAVVYHDLRRIKDGVDIEDLIQVFE